MILFKKNLIWAMRGAVKAYKNEKSFRIQIFFAIAVVLAGIFFNITRFEWSIIIFAIILVLSLEMINTAVEAALDMLKPKLHPDIEKIKDFLSGGVLIASLGSIIIGIFTFLPYIIGPF